MPSLSNETKKIIVSAAPGVLFVGLLFLVHIVSGALDVRLTRLGVYPLSVKGLPGIITAPLIHKDYDHLFSNALPILVLSAGIMYFYYVVSARTFLFVYLLTGFWVWLLGRTGAYHIGASGLVYGFAGFLFFSGLFRKDRGSIAISLIVTFIYGSMVWGVFPFVPSVSWESHLFGGMTGLVLAWLYRKQGVVLEEPELEEEEDEDYSHIPWQTDDTEQPEATEAPEVPEKPRITIWYTIVPDKPKIEKEPPNA